MLNETIELTRGECGLIAVAVGLLFAGMYVVDTWRIHCAREDNEFLSKLLTIASRNKEEAEKTAARAMSQREALARRVAELEDERDGITLPSFRSAEVATEPEIHVEVVS